MKKDKELEKEIIKDVLTLVLEEHRVLFGKLLNECENKTFTNYARAAVEKAHTELGKQMRDTSMQFINKLIDKKVSNN